MPKTQIEIKLDAEILSLLDKLKETTKDSEDYGKLVDRTSKLHKLKLEEEAVRLKSEEPPERPKPLLSPDVMLSVAANIFGILWLTRYEKEHVTNRTVLGWVMKPRT